MNSIYWEIFGFSLIFIAIFGGIEKQLTRIADICEQAAAEENRSRV